MKKNLVRGLVAAVVIVAVVIVARSWFAPAYDYDKDYAFAKSFLAPANTSDGRTVEARTFVFGDGGTYTTPLESDGRNILVLDKTLPANTFKIVRKTVPELKIGEKMFDKGGTYDQVRFNVDDTQKPLPVTAANAGR